MKLRRVISLLGCGLATAFVGSSARAGSTTGYPGTSCVQVMTNLSSATIYYEGTITRNQSGASKFFICNGVQQGGAITEWSVSVRDTTPVGEVVCSARATAEFTSSAFVSPSVSSGVAFGGTKRLTGVGTTGFVAHGAKIIHCTMPPAGGADGSAVVSYSITEE
ncbi:MAG: hypothetical protein K0R38_2134 [Polyangiaceae bacterium]|jgi:hypothetical protein|nr:hypothetical protein [Polyangiaceae bacterium]